MSSNLSDQSSVPIFLINQLRSELDSSKLHYNNDYILITEDGQSFLLANCEVKHEYNPGGYNGYRVRVDSSAKFTSEEKDFIEYMTDKFNSPAHAPGDPGYKLNLLIRQISKEGNIIAEHMLYGWYPSMVTENTGGLSEVEGPFDQYELR